MCLEVKSDYQKSSWFKSLFHETNLGFWEMEPLRFAKNAFSAYSYGHEVS